MFPTRIPRAFCLIFWINFPPITVTLFCFFSYPDIYTVNKPQYHTKYPFHDNVKITIFIPSCIRPSLCYPGTNMTLMQLWLTFPSSLPSLTNGPSRTRWRLVITGEASIALNKWWGHLWWLKKSILYNYRPSQPTETST